MAQNGRFSNVSSVTDAAPGVSRWDIGMIGFKDSIQDELGISSQLLLWLNNYLTGYTDILQLI